MKDKRRIKSFNEHKENLNISDVSDSIYYIYDEFNKKYYAGIPNTHDVFSKYKSEANIYYSEKHAKKHIDEIKDDILKKNLVITK